MSIGRSACNTPGEGGTLPPESRETRVNAGPETQKTPESRCLPTTPGPALSSPDRTRTCDRRINSPLLYQLSYRGSCTARATVRVRSNGEEKQNILWPVDSTIATRECRSLQI